MKTFMGYDDDFYIQNALANSRFDEGGLLKHHVPRLQIESTISEFIDAPLVKRYLVITGARGTGKSTAVAAVAKGKSSVIHLKVKSEEDDFYSLLSAEIGTDKDTKINIIAAKLRSAHKIDPVTGKILVPTIVLDVNMKSEQSKLVKDAAIVAKELAVDGAVANVIIILSDNNAAFGLPVDHSRRDLICIDDFTKEEAREYGDKIGLLTGEKNATARNVVFDVIGTRPSTLAAVAKEQHNLDEYVRRTLVGADSEMRSFVYFGYGDLIKMLNISDRGVPMASATAANKEFYRVLVAQNSIATKLHVVLYSQCDTKYYFQSQAFQYVARHPHWEENSFSDLVKLEEARENKVKRENYP